MNEILKETLDKIKNKEITSEVVNAFLCVYYDDYIDGLNKREEASYPEELLLPLEERTSGVYEAMRLLVEQRYDLNEGEEFNPLMITVGNADASMTEFLIKNGADANYWPYMDEEPEYMRDNYYLEDIDTACMAMDWPESERYVYALAQTARVLLEEGNTGSFSGICLKADAEKRQISLPGINYLY